MIISSRENSQSAAGVSICRAAVALCICALVVISPGCDKESSHLPKSLSIDLGGEISLELVLVDAGYFMMGSNKGRPDEQPVRKVTIAKPFYMGKYEITQEQWEAVMGANPSHFKGEKNPVDSVSWEDCQAFLKKLSEKAPGKIFKLPTETQWEYACRAGSKTEYTHGDDVQGLKNYAWFDANNPPQTSRPVGLKKPNAWGLYDMHGNVWEWCADWYNTYDNAATSSESERVLRGGSWGSDSQNQRSARRNRREPGYQNRSAGFRLCMDSQ